jgi:hypothetical protein
MAPWVSLLIDDGRRGLLCYGQPHDPPTRLIHGYTKPHFFSAGLQGQLADNAHARFKDKPLATFHYSLSASIGSIEAALRAGMNPATAAQIPSAVTAPRYAIGSSALTL